MKTLELVTETERSLYAEALFLCADQGKISDVAACENFVTVVEKVTDFTFSRTDQYCFQRCVEGIFQAYRIGGIDRALSIASLAATLEAAAANNAILFNTLGIKVAA